MKSILPLLAAVLLISSCSTAYKSGQTPDDVYYSPAPKNMGQEYVQMNREDDRRFRRQTQEEAINDAYAYNDDRYLRMRVRNRRMWSDLDFYYNDPMAFRPFNRYWGGSYWNPGGYWNAYTTWDHFYNPYFRPFGNVVVINPASPVYSRPRTMNLNTFNNYGTPVYDPKRSNNSYSSPGNNNNRSYSQPRSFGNEMRSSFGNNSSNTNSSSAPSRSSAPSSSGSSGSSSGSSNAPVRKF